MWYKLVIINADVLLNMPEKLKDTMSRSRIRRDITASFELIDSIRREPRFSPVSPYKIFCEEKKLFSPPGGVSQYSVQVTFEEIAIRNLNSENNVNLLPRNKSSDKLFPLLNDVNPYDFERYLILNSLAGRNTRTINEIIQSMAIDDGIDKNELEQSLARFDSAIGEFGIRDEKQLAKLLQIRGLLIYESSYASYEGTFVLPDEILERLPENKVYLEIGVGPGDNLRKIIEEKTSAYAIGCDLSTGMIYRAQKNFPQGKFFVGDAEDLSILDGTVDVVVICNALDRISTAKSTIKRLGSLVKPDGYLVVGQCVPFQNEYIDRISGLRFGYVLKDERLNSVDEALYAAKFKTVYKNEKPFGWNVKTLLYGEENLEVNVAIGRKIM